MVGLCFTVLLLVSLHSQLLLVYLSHTRMALVPQTYKLILAGDGGTGKTALLIRLVTGVFERRCLPTVGVEIYPVYFHTNQGEFPFHVWDTAGRSIFRGHPRAYMGSGDCAIVMFDIFSKYTLEKARRELRDIREALPDIPIILCGNKTDVLTSPPVPATIRGHTILRPRNLPQPTRVSDETVREVLSEYPGVEFCEMSVKEDRKTREPFLRLARRLVGDETLSFTDRRAFQPTEETEG